LLKAGQIHKVALLRCPSEPVAAAESRWPGQSDSSWCRLWNRQTSARTFCIPPEVLETERTSLRQTRNQLCWLRPRRLRPGLRLATFERVATCGDSIPTMFGTGAPANPGDQVDGRACLRRARGRALRPFSGCRLSRWSTVGCALEGGSPLRRCGRIRYL